MNSAIDRCLDSRDFSRVARSLLWLDDHWREQPSLQAMAVAAGLSLSHFDRLFHAWAGITPKNYLQLLTGAAAREALRRRRSLLDTALDVGLSGPGRLHDLIVKLEAMSPAEWARGGDGLTLACGVARSPFGWLLSAESSRGLCHLGFVDSPARAPALAQLQALWPAARLEWQPAAAQALSARLWQGSIDRPAPLRLCVRGSRFQVKVWQALLNTRPSENTSYARLAVQAGEAGSARAVGGAVAANPIAWLIPCHRVLRTGGALGGYHWGTERKRAMLAWEQLRATA